MKKRNQKKSDDSWLLKTTIGDKLVLILSRYVVCKCQKKISMQFLWSVEYWLHFENSLKVSKSQKQNTKFAHTPKNQQNFVNVFALASKSDSIKKKRSLLC